MTIKVATISLCANDDRSQNIAKALSFVDEAAHSGAQWVVLPEVFHYHGPYDRFPEIAESDNSPLIEQLRKAAATNKIVLFAGSVCERSTEDRVYNTLYVINRSGEILQKYRKIHLFNLRDSSGKALYCESDGFLPGDNFVSVEIDGLRVGLAICYDLRFPEMFAVLNRPIPQDVFVIPAAFTKSTGEAHWELLLRARAVENQAYVIAANQVGEHRPGRYSFGHSMIIDPWGIKLCDSGTAEGIAYAAIDPDRIREVRGQLPALENRRPELY